MLKKQNVAFKLKLHCVCIVVKTKAG